jgi:chromosome segregation ATPase
VGGHKFTKRRHETLEEKNVKVEDWEDTKTYNEAYERQIAEVQAGRMKVDPHTRQTLQSYLTKKHTHRKNAIDEYESETAARWAALGSKVRCLRHVRLEHSAFAPGTRIREAWDAMNELRPLHETLSQECSELRAKLDAAQKALDSYDAETATSPHEFVSALAEVDFYKRNLRAVTQKALPARERFDQATHTFRSAYAVYSRLVREVNAIGDLNRPLARNEREARSREAAEVARLEHLIYAILTPVAKVAQKRSAA